MWDTLKLDPNSGTATPGDRSRFWRGELDPKPAQATGYWTRCKYSGCVNERLYYADFCVVHAQDLADQQNAASAAQPPQTVNGAEPKGRSTKDQPAPTTSPQSQPVLVLLAKRFDVSEDTLARLALREATVGVPKYGQPLMTSDGRDTQRDLHEEALDAIAYAAKLCLERPDDVRAVEALEAALVLEKAAAHLGVLR